MDRVLRLTGSPGGSQDAFDFAMRSGLVLPVDGSAAWRPLSDRGIDALAAALDGSRVGAVLLTWCGGLGIEGINPFYRSGLNRARTARLVWQAVADQTVRRPVEAIATVTLPDTYGRPSSGMTFTLDVVIRARSFLAALPDGPQAPPDHWLTVPQLYELCDALLMSLTDTKVATQLADLAGVDPVLVPQLANLDFVTSTDVSQLLDLSASSWSPMRVPRAVRTWWPTRRSTCATPMNALLRWTAGCSRSDLTLGCAGWSACWRSTTAWHVIQIDG